MTANEHYNVVSVFQHLHAVDGVNSSSVCAAFPANGKQNVYCHSVIDIVVAVIIIQIGLRRQCNSSISQGELFGSSI